jgi:hypothetical protein
VRQLARTLACALLAGALAAQVEAPNERTETWPDGTVKLRYTVDEEGRRDGRCEQFAANGKRVLFAVWAHGLRDGEWREWNEDGSRLRALAYSKDVLNGHCEEWRLDGSTSWSGDYRAGKKHGKWIESDHSGLRKRIAEYRNGVFHGTVRIQQKDKVISKQTWKDGELQQLDDLQPFPVPREQLRTELCAILTQQAPADPKDAQAPLRLAALHRLQAYRHLCGLPWQNLELVPEWNLRCDAAAEICRRIGHLDHTPACPPDMDPARYRLGYEGTTHSNLAMDSSLPDSVDGYMDDSDRSNIDRVGHRRWCLNPAMGKTGFGTDGGFHAMWSMDASGGSAKGVANVFYPPRGYVPVDLFTAHRAFSISLLRGSAPKKDALAVKITALDDDYLPNGEPLHLDWCEVAAGGYGGSPCIVFRAPAIVVAPNSRYVVEVSSDGGKSSDLRYVVEFCAAIGDSGDTVK